MKDEFEQTANKTGREITRFYDEILEPNLDLFREMCRKYVSRKLIDTDEDHPYECDIELQPEFEFGLSSLELPHVESMYQEPTGGSIWLNIDGSDCDFDWVPSFELIQIINYLEDED